MNTKPIDKVKSYPIMVRLTREENRMAKELRSKHNVNISSFVRNAIAKLYEKVNNE